MIQFFLRIFDFLKEQRRLTMGLLVVLIGILLAMVSSLKYNENIYDFLPVSGHEQKTITLYQDISGGQRILVMFSKKDDKDATTSHLTDAVDTFSLKVQTGLGSKHIREVTTQVDFDKIAGITDFIYKNMPLMLNDSDYVRMENILSSQEIVNEQLSNDVQIIMMPATGFFTSNISSDPLSLFSPVMERLQAKQMARPIEIDDGYIFTTGKQYALAILTSPYGSMESANNTLLVNYLDSISQQTMQACPHVQIAMTGSPVIAVDNANQIKTDSRLAITIAATLILLLLILSFRSGKNLALIGISILFGWVFAMGFIAVLRSDVSLIVLGIGSIIIGIAVNYPLHFIAHTGHEETTRDVLKEMVAPLLIGNITTVGAFASLIPLDAPALRDLGLFAAFMLIGTILFVLIFLPHLVKKRAGRKKERLYFGRLSAMSPDRHPWLLWAIFLLTIVFGYYSLGTSFDTDMHHVNYMTPTQQKLMGDLHMSAGVNDTSNVYIVTEGNTWDAALKERARIAPLLDSMKQSKLVKSYSDVTMFICSEEEQQQRIEKWNSFWTTHRAQATALLNANAPKYGFNADAFSSFYDIINADYSPKPFDYFEPIRSVLLGNSFSESTGCCSVVDVIDVGQKDLSEIEDRLNHAFGDTGYAFDFKRMNSAIANALSNDFNYIGFACGFIVFLFLWLSFGRLELSLLAFLPMAVGWIWILGIMYLFGMQFNIVNVILATFIFGQGDDYTIFITEGLINEYAYKKRLLPSFKNSIIISALIMFIGIGSLIVAQHPALHSLAEVTIVGMLTVVLMAWIIPPLIFNWMIKTGNVIRKHPITIEHLLRTTYCTIIYLFELGYGCLFGFIIRLFPKKKQLACEAWFHRLINKTMCANIHHIWGVRSIIHNEHGEDFSRGSIIICNHQSILDPIFMLALSPHVLILISEKVWKNPIVHTLFKLARFINLNQPIEQLTAQISTAVGNGYNVVIFPEGKRNNNQITRFHKGAFHIAQEISADILPVYLHGADQVMPKGSGFASRGQVDVRIGKRIPATELQQYGATPQERAHYFFHHYQQEFEQMKRDIELTDYFHHYIISKYTYKGVGIEKETKHLLKKYDNFSQWIDHYRPTTTTTDTVNIINAGNGQFSLLFALVHPKTAVHSYTDNADEAALLSAMEPMPSNLHVHLVNDEMQQDENVHTIDLSSIIGKA